MKKILLVVDYQNDFVDGTLGFPKAITLDKLIEARVKQALKDGYEVWYTLDTHDANDYLNTQEGKRLPIPHTIFQTYGHNLYGNTGKLLNSNPTTEIIKYTFGSSELLKLLQKEEEMLTMSCEHITEIELCGVVTNMCVISNAVICKAALPEARIVINAKLCASFDDDMHEKALDVMKSMQMDVINRE